MLEIKQVKDRQEWEDFLSKCDPHMFVQSWRYGEFNLTMGDEPFVFGIYENNILIGGGLFIFVHAKRGDFFYAPYSPIINYGDPQSLKQFFKFAAEFARERGASFIRISPFVDDSPEIRRNLQTLNFRKAPMHMIAEYTWILPLSTDENEILKNMKQNHRNLIRRAAKDGVKIVKSEDVRDVAKIHELLEMTSARHKFVPFSLKYLEEEFKAFSPDHVKIYFAYHENDLLAGNIIYFYGDTAVYRHGASSGLKQKIPASYLLQWESICDAKKLGLRYYNFWGIAPEGDKKHPFYGITHFKKGFGGFDKTLLPAHDLPLNFKYYFNFLIETLRRIKRGF